MLHHGLLSKKPKSFSQNQEKFVEKNNKNIVESLSVHLTQSLISNDQEMIDFCLSNTDENLIQNTIENLKNTYLSLFLDVLIAKIISYPNRSKNLIRWLKYLLRSNTSYFIGCVDLKQKFANLQTILLNKTRNLPKLIDLKNKILCINDKNSENTDFGLRKKVNTGLDSRKHRPLLIIEEGELEKFEEIKLGMEEEEKGKKNEFLEISMSENEENQTEKEFNKAIKIKQNELEEVNEEFIEI